MLHMPSLTNGWVLRDSNSRPKPCKGLALPAELSTRKNLFMILLRAREPAQGGAGLPRFAMEATPERRTARRVAARLVARLHGPIPLRGSLGQRSGGPSLADRRSSQIVNRF